MGAGDVDEGKENEGRKMERNSSRASEPGRGEADAQGDIALLFSPSGLILAPPLLISSVVEVVEVDGGRKVVTWVDLDGDRWCKKPNGEDCGRRRMGRGATRIGDESNVADMVVWN